jgi:hypothetical protein
MSLISEALKKAQAQRQGQTAPPASPPPVPTPTVMVGHLPRQIAAPSQGHPSPSGPRWVTIVALVAVLAVFFGGGTALVVWGLLGITDKEARTAAEAASGSPPTVVAAAAVAPTPSINPETPVEAPSIAPLAPAAAPAAPLSPVVFRVEEPTPPPPAEMPPAPASTAAPPVAPPTVVSFPTAPASAAVVGAGPSVPTSAAASPTKAAPPPVAPPAPPPPPPPDPAVEAFIASLEVRGVMTGGQKILLFDPTEQRSRAFSADDIVGAAWGLRVTRIGHQRLELTDERGASYTKRF